MSSLKRRRWLQTVGAGVLGLGGRSASGEEGESAEGQPTAEDAPLALRDFEPRSRLEAARTRIVSARFPVIDVHAHLTRSERSQNGVPVGDEARVLARPDDLLTMMGTKNVEAIVNVTGGTGTSLEETITTFDRAHPGRFLTLTEPSYARFAEADYPRQQGDAIEAARATGARGLKILKVLGLYLREQVTSGPLVPVDDPRFDPMWEACGALGMPVLIHVADPAAFFDPIDRFNERYEELVEHPDWSFHGKDFPSRAELLEARNRVIERHPSTTFVGLHVGNNPEDLGDVAACFDRYPNFHVEIGARIAELGRQPRAAGRFFDRYQDRILFGTDVVPPGPEVAAERFAEHYDIYFRFLESEDEYFPYSAARVPPQGRWRIYGLGLSDTILKKVYHLNARRLFGITA
jgi:predicted TIM-barrel fold metal-dependent hydrolase